MKVLKRPMFKYGGDVKKQGIMHKMNGLRNGGMATTMADATGMANGGMIRQGYENGLLVAPGVPNFYASNTPKKFENMSLKDKIFRPAPNPINFPGPEKIDRSDPKVIADLDAVDGDVQKYYANQREKDKIEKERVKSIYAPSEFYEYDREEGSIANPDKKTEQELFLETEGGDKSKTKDLTLSKEQTDAKRIKRAYDILGVDDAKKDAVYNSLIDLSQAQAIDTKDISGSINRAVGALSRRTDKVEDLKDKGKAALASGTIQEMFRDDRSNYAKVAQELVTSGVYKTYPEALKAVTKIDNDTLGKRILTNAKTQAGVKVNDKSILNTLAAEKDYKEEIFSKEMFNKKIKENEFTDAIDVVTKVKDLKVNDTSKDGLYKVGLTVIRVTNGYPAIVFNR